MWGKVSRSLDWSASSCGCFSRGGSRPTRPLEHKRIRDSSFLGDWVVDAAHTAITASTFGPKACSTWQEAPASRASQMYVHCTWPRTWCPPASCRHFLTFSELLRTRAYSSLLSSPLLWLTPTGPESFSIELLRRSPRSLGTIRENSRKLARKLAARFISRRSSRSCLTLPLHFVFSFLPYFSLFLYSLLTMRFYRSSIKVSTAHVSARSEIFPSRIFRIDFFSISRSSSSVTRHSQLKDARRFRAARGRYRLNAKTCKRNENVRESRPVPR